MAAIGVLEDQGIALKVTGVAGTGDNVVVIEAVSVERFTEFTIGSTAGAMDVQISLDGTNFLTAQLSLADLGAIVTDPVVVTVANRVYRFRGAYKSIRISQNGGVAVANAILLCTRER